MEKANTATEKVLLFVLLHDNNLVEGEYGYGEGEYGEGEYNEYGEGEYEGEYGEGEYNEYGEGEYNQFGMLFLRSNVSDSP